MLRHRDGISLTLDILKGVTMLSFIWYLFYGESKTSQ
jgi:hypothetical protein